MQKALLLTIFSFFTFSSLLIAQDDVLFSVGDTKVNKSEFEYIYKKNNFNNKADYSRKSLEDYLNLYVNFRLKVKEAMAQDLDKTDRFKEELNSYEKQLADSYVDKDILERLIKQEYERSKTDVSISHIFFPAANNGDMADAMAKILEASQKLKAGVSFDEVAKTSQDKKSADNGGKLGWFNSFQISLPELEEAVYQMKIGEVSEPVKTRLGYHIIKLNETRPARQKLKVAIIKRFFPIADTTAKGKKMTEDSINAAYSKLKANMPFEKVVELYSEDDQSKISNGQLDWFGINTYAKIFEETAYALKDGAYSLPFKTTTAWYIVKRLETAKQLSYEEAVPVLKTKLPNLPQYQYELDKFTQKLNIKYGINKFSENISSFKQRLIDLSTVTPFTYRDTSTAKTLLQIGTTKYSENDFGKKIQESFYTVYPKAGSDKYDALIKNTTQNFILEYYKNDIKENNAEYKSLMDEYRNGIMIFSLSEKNIWNKATEDSVGLLAYYNDHKQDFNLKKRATVRTVTTETEKQAKAVYKILQLNKGITDDELIAKMKAAGIAQPKLNAQVLDETKTKLNIASASLSLPKLVNGKYEITHIFNLQEPKTRAFDECRGYVVAAYQEFLEKKWLDELKIKYPVQLNKAVFENMVKK